MMTSTASSTTEAVPDAGRRSAPSTMPDVESTERGDERDIPERDGHPVGARLDPRGNRTRAQDEGRGGCDRRFAGAQ